MPESLTGPLIFRPPVLDADIPRLTRLFNAVEAMDKERGGITEEELDARIRWPVYDLARDAWVVAAPGDPDQLIAHGITWKAETTTRGSLVIKVHPVWRWRGLGSALLTRALARLGDKRAEYVTATTDARHTAGQAFLRGHGFHPFTSEVTMLAPATTALPAPIWPPGYTVRSYAEIQEPAVLLEAMNRGFVGNLAYREASAEEQGHWLAAPETRHDGIFLAFTPTGDVAGVCWAEISAGRSARHGTRTGYIDSLAVLPAHRRQGLGRALLLTGMAWLRAQGQGAIELDAWIDNARAQPLYQGTGFVATREHVWYRREL